MSNDQYKTCFLFCRRWHKASNELQTHVVSSRARRTVTPKTAVPIALPPPPPPPAAIRDTSSGGSVFGNLGNKVVRLFTGSTKGAATEPKTVAFPTASADNSKRNYGFATSNLSLFSDQHSEDLYRYKNMSSDYMREESPPRTEDNTAANLRPALPPPARQRHDDDVDPSAQAVYPTRAAMRQTRREEKPIVLPHTDRFNPNTEETNDTKPTEQNDSKSNNDTESERL